MKTFQIALLLASVLLPGCTRYSYDLKGALEYRELNYRHEAVVEVVGSTNGPFRCLGVGGILSKEQPGKLGFAPVHGTAVSWTAPDHHTNSYLSYVFENPSGEHMLIIKSISN
jgi:hypothetical protein